MVICNNNQLKTDVTNHDMLVPPCSIHRQLPRCAVCKINKTCCTSMSVLDILTLHLAQGRCTTSNFAAYDRHCLLQ